MTTEPADGDISTEDLSELINTFSTMFKNEEFDKFDKLLAGATPEIMARMYSTEIVAYARGSFGVKHKLKEWSGFVRRMKVEFDHRSGDGANMVRGMEFFQPNNPPTEA